MIKFALLHILVYVLFALGCLKGAALVIAYTFPFIGLIICIVSGVLSMKMLNNFYLPIIINMVAWLIYAYCLRISDSPITGALIVSVVAGAVTFISALIT